MLRLPRNLGNMQQMLLMSLVCGITACGGGGSNNGSGSSPPPPPPPPANVAPTAVASVSESAAYSSQLIELDASSSSDSDGTIASYAWVQVSGPSVDIEDPAAVSTSFTVPPLSAPTVVSLRLTVLDDDGAEDSIEISIDVSAAPIVVNASVANGDAFQFSDESIELVVNSLELEGSSVEALSMTWESDIQGSLATGFNIGEVVQVSLSPATHQLSLTVDAGQYGIINFDSGLLVPPRTLPISAFQQTPASGYQELMPVVIVSHIPTLDGITLDTVEANYSYRPPEWHGNDVSGIIEYVQKIATRKKFFLEERSRFRGYKDPQAAPYLGYQVVAHYLFFDPLPRSARQNPFDANQTIVDYEAILDKVNGQSWVDVTDVKEFWLMSYFSEEVHVWESNMSSPTTADISNSDRYQGDLPIFDSTYIVYGVNYHRTQAEAIHNYGHQLEAMFDYVDRVDSGTSELFWGKYVGIPGFPGPQMQLGRCGWTHMPPNTDIHYDYLNQTPHQSDCEDWRPDASGVNKQISAAYFEDLDIAWPESSNIPQKAETQFYLWWMQNMPGVGNSIPFEDTSMENWWRFVADWDSAIADGLKLYVVAN